MQRMGHIIGVKPETLAQYKRLHADVWPGVLERLRLSNITNYSIFLHESEYLLFSYWEYTGTDFVADNAAIAADPTTKEWWALCCPMQDPLKNRKEGEWWTPMEPVFYMA